MGSEQLYLVLYTGLRLRSGVQGLQKAAPEPLVENRQVTLPSCKPFWQPRRRLRCVGRRTSWRTVKSGGCGRSHTGRRMSTRVT